MVKISPSILTADFANLEREIREACEGGADYLHLDVMDGLFVPNLSFGLPVVRSLRRVSPVPLDVHLMIHRPERYIDRFAEAGAGILTVHLEAVEDGHVEKTLWGIRAMGAKPGLSVRPGTPVAAVRPYVELLDLLLIMTVEPGFGGQTFMPGAPERISEAREMLESLNPSCVLEVDGGIDAGTLHAAVRAGADIAVIGSAVFAPGLDPAERVGFFKEMLQERGKRQ